MATARIFYKLMLRLGFQEFYLQGGDWGALICTNMAQLVPRGGSCQVCAWGGCTAHARWALCNRWILHARLCLGIVSEPWDGGHTAGWRAQGR